MTKPKITKEMKDLCLKPFPKEAYSVIEGKSYLTTLKAYYITERLNEVFGVGRWTIETEEVFRDDKEVVLKGNFVALDYDVVLPKQFGGARIQGKGTSVSDGFKSAVTDCQSKLASYLGIGAEMFKGKIKLGPQGKQTQNKDFASKKNILKLPKNPLYIFGAYNDREKIKKLDGGAVYLSDKKVWAVADIPKNRERLVYIDNEKILDKNGEQIYLT